MTSRFCSVLFVVVALLGHGAPVQSRTGEPVRSGTVPGAAAAFSHDDLGCLEPVPEAVSIRAVTDTGDEIVLDVLVLLDGISTSRGKAVMKKASEAYRPLDVRLKPRFRRVAFPTDGEVGVLFEHTLRAVGGKRPKGIDVVYLMTNKDIYMLEDGQRRYGIAGVAYCIGGVRYADAAFAIGEGMSPWEYWINDRTFSAKIAAHEIGHLMGAHHHYGNCLEGSGTTDGGGEPSVCTVMWPATIEFSSLTFGTLESAVIRGHAVQFASP